MEWWKSVLWCIYFFSHIVFTTAQLSCSQQQYMYSPTSCLELRQNQPLSNQAAQSNCIGDLTGLATFEEYEQFEALQSFLEVLLKDSDPLWLGYYYDTNGDVRLRGSGELSESPVFGNAGNFASGGSSAGDGVCIAIGGDGQLWRRMCTDMLSYACYQDQAPRVVSITIDGSRFLPNADTRTLTCNYHPPNADVMWRRNNDPVPDASDSVISSSPGQSNLTISSFEPQGSNIFDLFECVVNNTVGGVVSEAIGLVEAPSGTDMPVPVISPIITSPQRSDIRTGSSVNLTCNSSDTMANYSWFINGIRVDSVTSTTLQISNFLPGFYQCRAALSTGENAVSTIRLDPRDPPAADESIAAIPHNRMSILVAWTQPSGFTRDPALLRYTLYYTSTAPRNPFNFSAADSVPNLPPRLGNGSVSRYENGILEYVLPNLEIGTEYWISVRASYLGVDGMDSEYFAFSSTYGNVPEGPVQNIIVSRTPSNKSILVQWDKLVSELPFGEVVLYQVEYRNRGKDITMTARISATYDFFSILNLEDASAYEVRVRAGVQVSSDPSEFELGEPTEWKLADRIVPSVPLPPPTLPVRPPLSDKVIAAIVVVVVLVSFLVLFILVVGLLYGIKGRREKGESSRERTHSFKELKKHDENEKEGSPAS